MQYEVIVPDGVCGIWRVESFEITERQAEFAALRAAIGHRHEMVRPGHYKKLMRDDVVVMSNTLNEALTNQVFIRRATGRVLINGLGLGMVLHAILQKPGVTAVTVIEKAPEVITLVGPSFTDPRVTIIEADALTYQPPVGVRFDTAWHDIWDNIVPENLPEMSRLHRRYARRTKWQASWAHEECLYSRSQRQRRYG